MKVIEDMHKTWFGIRTNEYWKDIAESDGARTTVIVSVVRIFGIVLDEQTSITREIIAPSIEDTALEDGIERLRGAWERSQQRKEDKAIDKLVKTG